MKNTVTLINNIPTLKVHEPSELSSFELIDVRRADEFNGELGHIEGAKLVTLGDDLQHFLASEDKTKKILFICRSGMRSASATELALSQGFTEVFNMDGGMIDWNEKEYPITRDA